MQRAPISDPICPPKTYWDRSELACTHARATCGGWDGFSCDPTGATPADKERAARNEFARIDGEARAVCPEDDEAKQVYSGNAKEVFGAVDAAFGRAEQLGQRLADLREAQQTPWWNVATYARAGSLYDCIWNSLKSATPPSLAPQQQALVVKLTTIAVPLSAPLSSPGQIGAAQQIQQQINDVRQQIIAKWHEAQDRYLARLETRMVPDYVSAALLARRYALEGFDFTRANRRLPVVASVLGDEKMVLLLKDLADPTDPENDESKRRRIGYRAGAFGVVP